MANVTPSSVTLIFYRLGPLTEEPFLNIVASAMQMSALCHCEIAIGESVGSNGEMVNVARVFNDNTGVVKRIYSNSAPSAASNRIRVRCNLPGARAPHRPQPAVLLPAAGLLGAGGEAHDLLREGAGREAVFADGDGAKHILSANLRPQVLVLRGAHGGDTAGWGAAQLTE